MTADRIREIDTELGRLKFFGSECLKCSNTTPYSMVCDECGSRDKTTPLWIDADAEYEDD